MSTLYIDYRSLPDGLGTFEDGYEFLIKYNNKETTSQEYDSIITLRESEFTADVISELEEIVEKHNIHSVHDPDFFNQLLMNMNLSEYAGFEDISDLNLQELNLDTQKFLQENEDSTPFPINIWLTENKKLFKDL